MIGPTWHAAPPGGREARRIAVLEAGIMTTTTREAPPAPLKFERRRCPRRPLDGQASVFCLASDAFGRIHDLRLVDGCEDGVGAVSDTVIEPGTMVSVGFSIPGYIARRGVVTRCLPCGDGYRVAISYEQRMAA